MIVNHENILKPDRNWYNGKTSTARVIAWMSGGIASMVACHLALRKYSNVHLAFCDTSLESPDTYRFLNDFERITNTQP